ncbi:hypothetical protein LCGC14_2392720, partial [marine sediment metagenome]
MYNSNSRKSKRVFILFLITTTLGFFTINQLKWNLTGSLTDPNSPNEVELLSELKISDYSSNFVNTGENMNITLHQSYLNTSFNTDLNLSDPNNSSFILPSPKEINFNSSYTKISIDEIYAQNYTIVVEDDFAGGSGFHNLDTDPIYMSFETKGVGYIENISIRLREFNLIDNTLLQLRFFNSEYDVGKSGIRPKNQLAFLVSAEVINDVSMFWWNLTNVHQFYNSSETYNNTFFIFAEMDSGSDIAAIIYLSGAFDDSNPDNNDESIVLDTSEDEFQKDGTDHIDINLKVSVSPYNVSAKPSYIDLQINNTKVYDINNGSGYMLGENQGYSDLDGLLEFEVTADWWDVTCNISQVQINYTKTDLLASSSFQIPGNNLDVAWNVTRNGGFNNFDSDFNNYKINFTIPAT